MKVTERYIPVENFNARTAFRFVFVNDASVEYCPKGRKIYTTLAVLMASRARPKSSLYFNIVQTIRTDLFIYRHVFCLAAFEPYVHDGGRFYILTLLSSPT
jgi:hypothetical protein